MSREIKFRAKDYRGNWQYGTYAFGCFYPDSHKSHRIFPYGDYIDEKTLGQFTGLKDENKKEIYEGDICEHKPIGAEHRERGVVSIHPTQGVKIGNWPMCFDVEIIGNIYEEVNTDESKSSKQHHTDEQQEEKEADKG